MEKQEHNWKRAEDLAITNGKTSNNFLKDFYATTPKKTYVTNKTDLYLIDNTWSADSSD